METDLILGTLTIGTIVILGNRERTITLANIPCVERVECENHIQQFCIDNPQYRKGMLFANWVVKESIMLTREMRAN